MDRVRVDWDGEWAAFRAWAGDDYRRPVTELDDDEGTCIERLRAGHGWLVVSGGGAKRTRIDARQVVLALYLEVEVVDTAVQGRTPAAVCGHDPLFDEPPER